MTQAVSPVQTTISRERARAILARGTDCLDDLEVQKAFGITLDPNDIPPIPFTDDEIVYARQLGQFLVLFADKNPAGQVLTMQGVDQICGGKLGDDPLLYDRGWYQGESFYTTDPIAPTPTWKLVGRDVIPGSTNKNYLDQTQVIVDYLTSEVYAGEELPAPYQVAIDEFNANKNRLAVLMGSDWQQSAKELAALQVNQLFRLSPGELLYVIALYDKVNHERLLEDTYSWTASRYASGSLVIVGYAGASGASVYGYGPRYSSGSLGVVFSRSGLV